jgi:hypothetical protein
LTSLVPPISGTPSGGGSTQFAGISLALDIAIGIGLILSATCRGPRLVAQTQQTFTS